MHGLMKETVGNLHSSITEYVLTNEPRLTQIVQILIISKKKNQLLKFSHHNYHKGHFLEK